MIKIMNKLRIGVIPAAGKGIRAYPKTRYIPKPMVKVGGKPILQWNLEIMRDQLGIKEIYIIIGHLGNQIRNYFKDGSNFGVKIKYVIQKKQLGGIGAAIYLLKDDIKENFVVILGDEIYLDSNHKTLINLTNKKDFAAICCFIKTLEKDKIKKNYSGEFIDGRIKNLIEKPQKPKNEFLGCGTYIMTQKIFEYIEKTPPSKLRNEIEITDVLNKMAIDTKKVYPFILKGDYFNVTNGEDINSVNYLIRSKNFEKYKISIVIPAYNEKDSIERVIDEFNIPKIDEIIVVDNNSTDQTGQLASKKGAKIIFEQKKGYGSALKRGIDAAKGDIIILVEGDGTFRRKDLGKILEYLKDADMVIGTRTTGQMIEQGSNMGWFLRIGNVVLSKLIEGLWLSQEPRFTDVGCTFRGIWKDSYLKIKDNLHASGPEFSPEMMIETLKAHLRVIEIPISYYQRLGGESKHSVGFKKIKTGFKMLNLIFGKKFGWKK